MSDKDLKIPITVPGADEAIRQLQAVAQAEQAVGESAKQASQKSESALQAAQRSHAEMRREIEELRFEMQRNGTATDEQVERLIRLQDEADKLRTDLDAATASTARHTDVLRAAKSGAQDAGAGIGELKGAISQLGSAMGVNLSAFLNWKTGVVAAIALVIDGIRRTQKATEDFNDKLMEVYKNFAREATSTDAVRYARQRGMSEAAALVEINKLAEKYGLESRDVAVAADQIDAVFGREAAPDVQAAVFQFMRTNRIGGDAAASLVLAGHESGAKDLSGMQTFLAQIDALGTSGSGLTVESLSQVMTRMLPDAVAAGFEPGEFLAYATAQAKRSARPQQLTTKLDQAIKMVESERADDPSLSATAIINASADDLGIDVTTQEHFSKMSATAAGANFQTIADRFTLVLGGKPATFVKSTDQNQINQQQMAQERSLQAAIYERAKTEYDIAKNEGYDITGIFENLRDDKIVNEWIANHAARAMLQMARVDKSLTPEQRRAADIQFRAMIGGGGLFGANTAEFVAGSKLLESLGGQYAEVPDFSIDASGRINVTPQTPAQPASGGQREIGPQSSINYHGGTHYHLFDRRDPAGKPYPPYGQT